MSCFLSFMAIKLYITAPVLSSMLVIYFDFLPLRQEPD
jgi:hypothetical protein